MVWDVVVVGGGNAALCAAIAALERGASVLVVEKAKPDLAGGNSKYTAGAMRFVYESAEELSPLLRNPDDPRLPHTDFGTYSRDKFEADLLGFNDGRPISPEQRALIDGSYETVNWLASHDVKFEPIYSRQSFQKDGRHVFWGGLTLAADNEGVGLVEAELARYLKLGGKIVYDTAATDLLLVDGKVEGVLVRDGAGVETAIAAGAVVLGCGGFEANTQMRTQYIGSDWVKAKVRGTPHNTGDGLTMAFAAGARRHGFYGGCHATPMDLYTPDYGNLDIPHLERKHYRKICYFLGIMLNVNGERFVDEGKDFRNYTYAQFGRAVLEQPKHFAFQIFDSKVESLLYTEYKFHDAHYVEADTIDALIDRLEGLDDRARARQTIAAFNAAVDGSAAFDPTIKDGRRTRGLALDKTNWAQAIDTGPFRAYPVTGGITFTYGGLEVDSVGGVVGENGRAIPGLFACGELVGGVFYNGYPGGSGLTSGALFGRRAGYGASAFAFRLARPAISA